MHARDLNAVERGIRGYQYNASGAVKKGIHNLRICLAQRYRLVLKHMSTWCAAAAAEGKYTDDGSGGGNGTAYGILAATSLAVAVTLAVAPHTVGCPSTLVLCLWPVAHALNRVFTPHVLSMH